MKETLIMAKKGEDKVIRIQSIVRMFLAKNEKKRLRSKGSGKRSARQNASGSGAEKPKHSARQNQAHAD